MDPPKIQNSEPSLYLPKGDIVLLSSPDPEDNVMTAFKVDSIFLLRASPVFEGMLALPPSENVETYDNVPFVKLQDDAVHLTMFLKALYDPRCVPWRKHDLSTIQTVEGILILANKYQVDSLRERMVALLERDWPSELADWDDNEAEIKGKAKNFRDQVMRIGGEATMEDESMPDPCEVIRLARRCNLPNILPSAFYHLSRIPGTKDQRLSRSFADVVKSGYDACDWNGGRFADFSLLSAEDLRCLLVGRDALLYLFQGYLRYAFSVATYKPCCSSPEECEKGLSRFSSWIELRIRSYDDDVLSMMKRDADDAYFIFTDDGCVACRGRFLESLRSRRDSLWDRLPFIFLLNPRQ